MSFGSFVKGLRARKRVGLREFCMELGIDPSNWSKIERGISAPPKTKEILEKIARYFDLRENQEDWTKLHDLAAIESGTIPLDIIDNKNLVNKLPIFFRTLRGQKPTKREIDELIKVIKEN